MAPQLLPLVCVSPCHSCSLIKLDAQQHEAIKRVRETRRTALASLRAILAGAPALMSTEAASQAPGPSHKSALRQPQVPFPGQLPTPSYELWIQEAMAELPQGSAGRAAPKRPLPPTERSGHGVVDLTDTSPSKRLYVR